MTKNFLALLLLTLLTSCTLFSKKVESLVDSTSQDTPIKTIKKNLHCDKNNSLQLIFEDESTLKYYHAIIGSLFDNKNFSFIQKAAMLSLIEMSRRPDEASPTARLQYILRYKGKLFYFDSRPLNLEDTTKMPYLFALDSLLKNFDQSKSLISLSEVLDQVVPHSINVSPELANFLETNKNELEKNETFAEFFIKGDEVLTKHESFKRVSYKKIASSFYNEKLNNSLLYNTSKNSLDNINIGSTDLTLKCNADVSKESTPKDDFINSAQRKSHYFALKDDDNFFIAVSSSVIPKKLKNYKNTYLLLTQSPPFPIPLCQFTNKQEDIVLFSTSGRNPAQHLKHLITYDIDRANSYNSLEELLNFSRHLFLSSPDRILYESKRGRKSQLDFFLSMNFPIYHVDALGDIIGFANFKNHPSNKGSLIIDDRSPARLWCSP